MVGASAPDALGGGHTGEHGEREVHEDDVGTEVLGQLDGLLSVGRLPHHLVAGVLQGPVEPLADHGVVVGDQDPDHQATFIRIRTTVPRSGAGGDVQLGTDRIGSLSHPEKAIARCPFGLTGRHPDTVVGHLEQGPVGVAEPEDGRRSTRGRGVRRS